jgi:hypothetical protein
LHLYRQYLDGAGVDSFVSPFNQYRLHYDHKAGTIWGGYPLGQHIREFRIHNQVVEVITSGVIDAPYSPVDGAAVDSRDGSLWVNVDPTNPPFYVLHASRTPNPVTNFFPIISAFDVSSFMNHPADLAFDSSDNTLWVIGSSDKKIYHVTTAGAVLDDSIDLIAHGFPNSTDYKVVEYDKKNNNLWFADLTTRHAYHITKAGVLIADVNLDNLPNGPAGLTFVPSILM